MTEADEKRLIVNAIKKHGGYARRLEDQYAVGLPDLFIGLKGLPAVLIEAKLIRGNIFSPSPRQLQELIKLQSSGATVVPLVMGINDNGYYLGVNLEHRYDVRTNFLSKFGRGSDNIYTNLSNSVVEIINHRRLNK